MTLDEEFEIIKEFVKEDEGSFKKPSKKATYKYGDKKHFKSLKESFVKSRNLKMSIKEPETITDDALWEYIKLQKNLSDEKINEFAKYHKIAMSIETKLGSLLEGFIYKHISKHDWIWCSGNILQDIDFIKKKFNNEGNVEWISLQVKNSDNSENAASSRVRVGTNIKKWFRRLSKVKNKDNWIELIKIVNNDDEKLASELTEENYVKYLKS
jgi:hypothetical protein